jgi:hypothetical protein
MKKLLGVLILGVVLIGVSSCAKHTTIQKEMVVKPDLLPKMNITSPVAVEAVQHQVTGKDNFCRKGLGPITVYYSELTDYAEQSVTDILVRNNVQITPDADKKLVIHIAQVRCEQEAFTMNYLVDIDVTAGNIPKKVFTGNQRLWSMHALDFTMTAATLNAVLEIFKDKDIKSYLEN